MRDQPLIHSLFKTEYRKLISVLCHLFGLKHIEVAEDIVTDTFVQAAETWATKGVPDNPSAWLYTVAKNKTRDYLRRHRLFTEKIAAEIRLSQTQAEEIEIDLSPQNISDSQLRMIFAVCHPSIQAEAQIGLALRILCGFGIEEIAVAFLSNRDTISKRLFRAREKLRTEKITLELPGDAEIGERLDAVLTVIYLLFNEGYHSSISDTAIRKELCLEAMRLALLLLDNEGTNTPPVNALMSLMCFHASRFDARMSPGGEPILYEAQNRELWDEALIARGNQYLIASACGQEISKYHLEASIAYWHCTSLENTAKWENILQLYNKLLLIDYSPMVALNRTYALSKANGINAAIAEAEKLQLTGNHYYHVLLGELYSSLDAAKARQHFQQALALAKTKTDRQTIEKKLAVL